MGCYIGRLCISLDPLSGMVWTENEHNSRKQKQFISHLKAESAQFYVLESKEYIGELSSSTGGHTKVVCFKSSKHMSIPSNI